MLILYYTRYGVKNQSKNTKSKMGEARGDGCDNSCFPVFCWKTKMSETSVCQRQK